MRIDCHVPITLRIVGVPTDEQLEAAGRALTRAVAARLAEAERMLAERHPERATGAAGAAATPGPVGYPAVAHLDAAGLAHEEQRSAARAHGVPVGESEKPPDDPFAGALREAERESALAHPPAPPRPEPVVPGDRSQQDDALVPFFDPAADLWPLSGVEERIAVLAGETEERERASGRKVTHTRDNMIEYWKGRFVSSVDYILYRRGGGQRGKLAARLAAAEEKLAGEYRRLRAQAAAAADKRAAESLRLRSEQDPDVVDEILALHRAEEERYAARLAGVIARVEALRRDYGGRWRQVAERAAREFVVIAANEAAFLGHDPQPQVRVYGLPEYLEGTVPAADRPDVLAQGKDVPGSSPTVVRFIEAVRKETGRQVKADNYPRHASSNPLLGDRETVGEYSFDMDLSGFLEITEDGFYERDKLVGFLVAVDRAARHERIAWNAYYNDAVVAGRVNSAVGRRRILFSGGGGPKNDPGSFHHGPGLYVLHIHFNVMPVDIAAQYLVGNPTEVEID
ncbi:hypothetical protein [Streptomyces sp. GbtcB6]|uniref:hypothetical protein n=1 Tax=Streptomyces sp. GbtcB6 TaxID=2824751 RepID=UPI001C2FC0F3|nr:hypothetical protein [Streptomyces sp. GbtcB6]